MSRTGGHRENKSLREGIIKQGNLVHINALVLKPLESII